MSFGLISMPIGKILENRRCRCIGILQLYIIKIVKHNSRNHQEVSQHINQVIGLNFCTFRYFICKLGPLCKLLKSCKIAYEHFYISGDIASHFDLTRKSLNGSMREILIGYWFSLINMLIRSIMQIAQLLQISIRQFLHPGEVYNAFPT